MSKRSDPNNVLLGDLTDLLGDKDMAEDVLALIRKRLRDTALTANAAGFRLTTLMRLLGGWG